ncbi:hypothetical protein [Aliarcobacter cryaerophilus]|uniref:hypothetical protein n=1 Tax=Aliarcobacter cryaerophilus TaxID=28198 RepID=UPI003DA3E370
MKIAHLNYFPYFVPGLDKKIKEQALAARKLDLNLDFVILNQTFDKIEDNIIYKKIKKSNFFKRKLFRFKVIEENFNFEDYDFVILRYPMIKGFDSNSFINKYGYKIISEHHTDEIGEQKTFGNNISNKFIIYLEKYFSKYYLSNVKAIIGVTNEIIKVELNKINLDKKVFLFSNGIGMENTEVSKREKFEKVLNIIFVSSIFSPWQGLDRVIDGLKNYNGNIKINLKLIGKLNLQQKISLKALENNKCISIFIKDYVESKKIIFEYNGSHLAIGSLALNQKNMKEACPLKTREYIASGIPFIYSYDDSDLDGSEYFALKISTDSGPLDFEKIIDFAKYLDSKNTLQVDMINFALEKLDWKVKIASLYKFIKDDLNV